MACPPDGRLVGLITIETLAVESPPSGTTLTEREDATLQQVLIHLSGGASREISTSRAPAEVSAGRFACQCDPRWGGTTRLSANLDNLRAQLQLALAQALERIAGDR